VEAATYYGLADISSETLSGATTGRAEFIGAPCERIFFFFDILGARKDALNRSELYGFAI
jgi:hypothetical protein